MAEKPQTQLPRKFEFLPLSLHLETVGGIATPLALRGTPLPATRMEEFSTASDDQESVEVKILIGESPLSAKNKVVGTFYVKGLPKAPRGQPKIVVKFSVDQFCQVNASAAVDKTELHVESRFKDTEKYLTAEAIEVALTQAEAEKTDDQQKVSVIEARNSANAAIAAAQRELSKSPSITNERSRVINQKLAALGLALESDILERIHVATQELNKALGNDPIDSVLGDLFGLHRSIALHGRPGRLRESPLPHLGNPNLRAIQLIPEEYLI